MPYGRPRYEGVVMGEIAFVLFMVTACSQYTGGDFYGGEGCHVRWCEGPAYIAKTFESKDALEEYLGGHKLEAGALVLNVQKRRWHSVEQEERPQYVPKLVGVKEEEIQVDETNMLLHYDAGTDEIIFTE
jgi:hypothetical protein